MIGLLLTAAVLSNQSAASVAVPSQPDLTAQIAKADEGVFDLYFSGPCDAVKFRSMLTPDVEFYHDVAGFNVRSADEFVANYTEKCRGRADPNSLRIRRQLVAGSLKVDPVPGWGAIETGEHWFYARNGTKDVEHLVEKARFAQLWVLGSDGKWRLSRVFSYAHQPAN